MNMKNLHSKLFLILLSCIVVFVSVAYILVIHLTQQQTEIEKLDMNYGVLKQTVMSFEYLSDSIERYIFDQWPRRRDCQRDAADG